MKFLFRILEVFFTPKNLDRHYEKHVVSDEDGNKKMPEMSKEEYNALADKLSNSKAGHLNDKSAPIIGYVTVKDKTVKYEKSTGYTVVYVDDNERGHEAITLYKQPIGKFFNKVNNNPDFKFKSHIDDVAKETDSSQGDAEASSLGS